MYKLNNTGGNSNKNSASATLESSPNNRFNAKVMVS